MSHPSFVGIRELDREILLELDDETLDRACYVDRWTQSICDNPLFWRERILRKYGFEILQHKPLGETYYQQYQRLRRIKYEQDQYFYSIKYHHFDELLLLRRRGIELRPREMTLALIYGTIETLNWLAAQGLRPTSSSLDYAILGRSLENFKWVQRHGIPVGQGTTNDALRAGAVKILDYLFQDYNLLPHLDQRTLNALAAKGDLETFIWMNQHGLGLPSQENANLVKTIIDHIENEGPLTPEEKEIIYNNLFPRPFTASMNARIKKLRGEDINWDSIKRYLTQEEIDQVKRRYQDLLDWMISRGLH